MQKKELFFMFYLDSANKNMSHGRNFSSQPLSRGSNQDSSNSTNSAPSKQVSSQSSSFGGRWRRPNSDSRPQASGGSGWGRPHHAQAAVDGGWGRRPASSEASTQPPQETQQFQEPQQPQQHQEPQSQEEESAEQAPPEGYDYDFLMYSFKNKFNMPKDLPQDDLPLLDNLVMDYIARNPLRYGQTLKAATERALLKIHEELQSKLRRTIPEKDSHPPALTMSQEFSQKLTETLCAYRHTSTEHVIIFVLDYMKIPFEQLEFPGSYNKDTGRPLCLRSSQALTDQHRDHAIYTYFKSLVLPSILRTQFGFVDSMIPTLLLNQLPHRVRKLIKYARSSNGRCMNCFLMVYPPTTFNRKLRNDLEDALIQNRFQSYGVNFVSLTSEAPPKTGDICLVIPDEINTMTESDKKNGPAIITRKPVTSQYQTDAPRGVYIGLDEKLNWQERKLPYTFNTKNMQENMETFCGILRIHGAIPLYVDDDPKYSSLRQSTEQLKDHSSIHDDTSSAGGGWGAAVPK